MRVVVKIKVPFWCRIIIGTLKGTIILTTTHVDQQLISTGPEDSGRLQAACRVEDKGIRRSGFRGQDLELNPKAQNGPKALYSMVFGPKSLI